MEKNNTTDFSQPQRLDPKAVIILFADFIRKTIYPLFILYLFYREYLDSYLNIYTIGIFVIVGLIFSYLYYTRFVFYLREDELILEKGVFIKRKLSIKFDKIQHINTEQGILYQIFDLKKVIIDTAGSEGKEFVLPGLSEAKADQLQATILRQNKIKNPDAYEIQIEEEETIETLHIGKLILSSLIGNPFRITIAIVFYIFSYGVDNIRFISRFINIDEFNYDDLSILNWVLVAEIMLIFVIISFVLEIVLNLINYYDFRLVKLREFLVMNYGLFQRVNHSLSQKKIQMFLRKSNGLSRFLGFSQVRLFQVSPIQASSKKIERIPYVSQEINTWLEDWAMGKHELNQEVALQAHPIYGIRKGVVVSLMLIIIMSIIFYTMGVGEVFYLLGGLPFIIIYFYLWGRKAVFIQDEKWIYSSVGWWSISESVARAFKIQAISIRQSIFQRRRVTANLYFHLASSTIIFPEIPYHKAQEIYASNLKQIIEDPNRAWM